MREAAARTIADTVEKSTLYQRARATAELTKLLGRAPTADEILGAVSKAKIRIYTPTPVPRAVQSMIRKLVGRDALRLEFKVREAKFLDWPAY